MLFFTAAALGGFAFTASAKPHAAKIIVPRTELSHPCSRSVSRVVRKQLGSEVLTLASQQGYSEWPGNCAFDPSHDLYAEHEKQKLRRKPGTPGLAWHCGICGKTFKSEHYLDLHMERRHMNETPQAVPVCLADYCEVFEVCHGESRIRPKPAGNESRCDEHNLAVARQRCDTAMQVCFPLDKPIARRLHAQLSRHWCQVLDCQIREEKLRDLKDAHIPVVVWMILIVLVGFFSFCVVITCVDNSDDIIQFFVDSGLASIDCGRRCIRAKQGAREAVGVGRTRCV